MQKNIIYSSIAILLLTACGGGGSSTTTEKKIESVETVKTTIEKAGFTLTSLAPATSNKIQKTDPSTVSIAYTSTQKVDITADILYLIADSEQNEIFATIDAITLFDTIEQSQTLVMYHNGFIPNSGYVNLNTIQTNTNATEESILAEIQNAFAQITLNNPTTLKTAYTTGDDVNITYQTALKNQDETFECGGEVVVINAQKRYSTLYDVQSDVNCTLGKDKILVVNITLDVSNATEAPETLTTIDTYENIVPEIFNTNNTIKPETYRFNISSLLEENDITPEQIAEMSPEYIISFEYGGKIRFFDNPVEFIEFTNTTDNNLIYTPVLTITKFVNENPEKNSENSEKESYKTIAKYSFPVVEVLYEIGVEVTDIETTQRSITFSLDITNPENVESISVSDEDGYAVPQYDKTYKQEGLIAGKNYYYSISVNYKDGRVSENKEVIRTVEAPAQTQPAETVPTGPGQGG